MAKRSAKRARRQAPPPVAAEPPSRRQFWLGVLVAAAILVPLGWWARS